MRFEVINLREIKFRGIPADKSVTPNSNWEYGGINSDRTMIVGGIILTVIHPETIGEFTGILDIEGKEIFEGDIVKPFHPFIPATLKTVEYTTIRGCGFMLKSHGKNENLYYEIPTKYDPDNDLMIAEITVVGNIHQNPELIFNQGKSIRSSGGGQDDNFDL